MSTEENQKTIDPRVKNFLNEIRVNRLPIIENSTVSIIGIQGEKIPHDRTGVLYKIAEEHFILTAAHELADYVKHKIPLFVALNAPDVLPLPLVEARFHSTEVDGKDVSVIWIPPNLATEISKYKEFLNHSQINLFKAKSKGPFLFFGFPMDWSAKVYSESTILSTPLAFVGFPHQGEMNPHSNYNPDLHMVLQFSQDGLRISDGNPQELPKLNGISGCGIWQIGDIGYGDTSLQTPSKNSVTLVGIQNQWDSNYNYVKGTQVRHVLGLLLSNYPHLEAPMSIVY